MYKHVVKNAPMPEGVTDSVFKEEEVFPCALVCVNEENKSIIVWVPTYGRARILVDVWKKHMGAAKVALVLTSPTEDGTYIADVTSPLTQWF